MLKLEMHNLEFFDEDKEEFVSINQTILLEHSLLSISKWEAKWKKSYFDKNKTIEEFIDYVRCMTITSNVNSIIYKCLNQQHLDQISKYIDDSMTATTINSKRISQKYRRNRYTTSELVYCWMFTQNIPIECERWHFNRLMTLIQVCSIENNPNKKKMSNHDIMSQNAALNAARRAKYHTKG